MTDNRSAVTGEVYFAAKLVIILWLTHINVIKNVIFCHKPSRRPSCKLPGRPATPPGYAAPRAARPRQLPAGSHRRAALGRQPKTPLLLTLIIIIKDCTPPSRRRVRRAVTGRGRAGRWRARARGAQVGASSQSRGRARRQKRCGGPTARVAHASSRWRAHWASPDTTGMGCAAPGASGKTPIR